MTSKGDDVRDTDRIVTVKEDITSATVSKLDWHLNLLRDSADSDPPSHSTSQRYRITSLNVLYFAIIHNTDVEPNCVSRRVESPLDLAQKVSSR